MGFRELQQQLAISVTALENGGGFSDPQLPPQDGCSSKGMEHRGRREDIQSDKCIPLQNCEVNG